MNENRQLIYCVEDDSNIRDLLVYALESGGFQAKGFSEGVSFEAELEKKTPSIILLDIMLPFEDGISILRRLRKYKKTKDIPVILLTAKGSEYEKVQGLDAGADDYITKPFGVMELLSRVRAVLRRSEHTITDGELQIGSLRLDKSRHRATLEEQEILLTLKEFELLRCLMQNEEIVLTRDQLLERIWGYEFEGETRTVDAHIKSLRQKLGEGGSMIETVRGVGYRIGGQNEA